MRNYRHGAVDVADDIKHTGYSLRRRHMSFMSNKQGECDALPLHMCLHCGKHTCIDTFLLIKAISRRYSSSVFQRRLKIAFLRRTKRKKNTNRWVSLNYGIIHPGISSQTYLQQLIHSSTQLPWKRFS